MQQIRTITNHRHLIEVSVDDVERRTCRIICPDSGKNCENWAECGKDHRCDCGDPHEHEKDCDADCAEDHALDCDEWVWRDGMLHGEYHRQVGSYLCIQETGCWMPDWEIEFDQVNPEFAPGLYEFDYNEPDIDDASLLYITAMRPVSPV